MDEDPLPMRFDLPDKQVMHHPVPEVRGEDLPGLGAQVDEADRARGAIASRVQFLFQVEQILGQVHLEAQGARSAALAATAVQSAPRGSRRNCISGLASSFTFSQTPLPHTPDVFVVVHIAVVEVDVERVVFVVRDGRRRPARVPGIGFPRSIPIGVRPVSKHATWASRV